MLHYIYLLSSLLQENTSSVRLLNAALVNGYSIVTYQRPLRAHDALDLPIFTNGSQAVIWGVGPLNQKLEVSFHTLWSKGKETGDISNTRGGKYITKLEENSLPVFKLYYCFVCIMGCTLYIF